MPKTCKYDGCSNPVFGGGYCKYHQNSRTDKKPKRIKKISTKGVDRKKQKEALIGEDKKFYLEVWISQEHICNECGVYLGEEPLMYHFDHILEKSKYPSLRHDPANIQLLCLQCHDNKTRGILSDKMRETILATKVNLGI